MNACTYLLKRDSLLCTDCDMCSLLLPDSLREFQGSIIISATQYQRAEDAVQDTVRACPNDAISLSRRGDLVDGYWPNIYVDTISAINANTP